jgi:hypothetical protein
VPRNQKVAPDPESSDSLRAFFAWAKEYAPQTVALAVGALALLIVGIFGLSSGFSLRDILLASLLVIAIGAIGAVLARLVAPRTRTGLGNVFAWAIALLVVAVLALLVASAFTGLLPQGTALVARILQIPGLIPVSDHLTPINGPMRFDQLGDLVQPITTGDDAISRRQALAARGKLEIHSGGSLVIAGPGETRTLAVHTLILSNGTIVTNGQNLTIEVVDLISSNGRIVAFEGTQQNAGRPGRDGGSVRLVVRGRISGALSVNLSGERGADGSAGTAGLPGSAGREGDNASSGVFDCSRGAGAGGPGTPGQRGGDGEPGLNGGKGGSLVVEAADPASVRNAIRFVATGGPGGAGGAGGAGGRGGPGGPGGSPRGLCSGSGPRGADGPPGLPGSVGRPGATGEDGTVAVGPLAGGA